MKERALNMSEITRQGWETKLLKQSKRGLFHIIFSRTVITTLLLLLNSFLLFSFLFELFEGITLIFGGLAAATAIMLISMTMASAMENTCFRFFIKQKCLL